MQVASLPFTVTGVWAWGVGDGVGVGVGVAVGVAVGVSVGVAVGVAVGVSVGVGVGVGVTVGVGGGNEPGSVAVSVGVAVGVGVGVGVGVVRFLVSVFLQRWQVRLSTPFAGSGTHSPQSWPRAGFVSSSTVFFCVINPAPVNIAT